MEKIRIKDLDTDCVMAKKEKVPVWEHQDICCSGCVHDGFNECVSQNDKLGLLIDEEKMAMKIKECLYDSDEEFCWMIMKHLKSTIKQWAKMGVVKNE